MDIRETHLPTILMIDDESGSLELRKLVLEKNGFKVLTTTSNKEALELFHLYDIDVIVTDHLLGRTTASGLATEMKRSKPYVPIVSLSGTTNSEEALKYADHFLGKAESPETLILMLKQLVQQPLSKRTPVPLAPASPPADNATLRHLLAAIVEDSSDAILSKTLDGVIMSWNHAAELMYGYTNAEAIGRSVEMLLPPDRPDEIKHILSRLKLGERIFHYDTVRVAKDGHRLDVSLTISPIRDEQGNLVGASAIAHDITGRRKTEEALAKAEKLAMAGRLLTTVAHEINNPLGAIRNVLYLLQNNLELSDDARKYVEIAQDELKRVAEITRVTLGTQRGAASRFDSVRITKLLDDVLVLFARKFATLEVRVERKYRCDGEVIGSPGELRQVFSNLIVNAMDALAISGTKLILGVRPTRHVCTGETGVRVSILDNGPGIDPAHRSQLFQAFHTTKGEKGTGIGLWVSKNIVNAHGGTIRVRSSVRPGRSFTCFSVFLPLVSDETNAAT
jgi:PAS domain S-box-containing protein